MAGVRREGADGDASVRTGKNLRDVGALRALLDAWPDTPVYSTLIIPNLPYPVTYCPATNPAGITFIKTNAGCSARFGDAVLTAP